MPPSSPWQLSCCTPFDCCLCILVILFYFLESLPRRHLRPNPLSRLLFAQIRSETGPGQKDPFVDPSQSPARHMPKGSPPSHWAVPGHGYVAPIPLLVVILLLPKPQQSTSDASHTKNPGPLQAAEIVSCLPARRW